MRLIGLTGGIGMGKTTLANIFSVLGVPVIDTDVIARKIVDNEESVARAIEIQFGTGFFSKEGALDRRALGKVVFADKDSLKALEEILHPRIQEEWQKEARRWEEKGHTIGLIVIPLLFETNAASSFEFVVCVASGIQIQRKRLERRGWDSNEIEHRINAQLSIGEKISRSDFTIWNEGNLEVLEKQVRLILNSIEKSKLKTG